MIRGPDRGDDACTKRKIQVGNQQIYKQEKRGKGCGCNIDKIRTMVVRHEVTIRYCHQTLPTGRDDTAFLLTVRWLGLLQPWLLYRDCYWYHGLHRYVVVTPQGSVDVTLFTTIDGRPPSTSSSRCK